MIGPSLSDFLYKNYSEFIHTPLSRLLYSFIQLIWENKNLELMEKLNKNQKKLMIIMVYGPDFEELFEKINFSNIKEKEELYNYLLDVRKEFTVSNYDYIKKNNRYDDDLFRNILYKIIKISLKRDLDIMEDQMKMYDDLLKKTNLKDEIMFIFHQYYGYVIQNMIELEQFIDDEKIEFIKNYRNMIYDEKYSNNDLKKFFEEKILIFQDKLEYEFTLVKQKYNSYIHFLKKWVELLNNGEQLLKIYYSNQLFEEINIYQDICSMGEIYLIQLSAPLINKLTPLEQKNIIDKMSSGVRNRTKHLFVFSQTFENFFNEVWNDDRVSHIKYNLDITNKQKFEKQLEVITTTMNDIMEKFK